jgi:hypothetical protein
VSDAGVVPALRLGESAGLYDLLEEALTVGQAKDPRPDLRDHTPERNRRPGAGPVGRSRAADRDPP